MFGIIATIKLANCEKIDKVGFSIIDTYKVEPYKVDVTVKASTDCKKARQYYNKVLSFDLTDYRMHHTLNGLIVPVHKAIHKASHFGGVYLLGLKR